MILWLDTETVGLNGPCMRIQYAVDDGPVVFIDYPFKNEEANLILCRMLEVPETTVVAYNAAFDMYHIYRWAHSVVYKSVKPFACRVLDLQVPAMLYGPFKQFAFSRGKARSVARVRRIPVQAVNVVRSRVLIALRPLVPGEFKILVGEHECKGQPHLRTLSFSVDGGATLKAHARHYGAPTISLPDVWPLPPREMEKPWMRSYDHEAYEPWVKACQAVLNEPNFVAYCKLDILFLKLVAYYLYKERGTSVEGLIDHHSDCVHAVAYTRYHGFDVDLPKLEETRKYYESKVKKSEEALAGTNLKSHKERLALIRSVDPLVAATNKKVLESLAGSDRPSARIARDMLDCGRYRQRLLQVEKVIEAGRAYPSLRVMGTATGRMSGSDGLNWQGITQAENGLGIRAAMKVGCGGDFEALEVTIAAAAYNDTQLQADLDTGVDFHCQTAALIVRILKKPLTYEQILKGKEHDDTCKTLRKTAKTVNFGIIYGAQKTKIAETIGCSEPQAERFLQEFFDRYKGIGEYRKRTERLFCTADTDGWSRGSVREMSESCVDLLGFVRSFSFERAVAGVLWGLAGTKLNLPGGFVTRSQEKGSQTVANAVKSAFFGGAIAIQQAVSRAACNSPVQSTGANLTKILMAGLWNKLHIPLLNIHDELISTAEVTKEMEEILEEFLKTYRGKVRSLNITMKEIKRWSEK